MLKLLTFAHRGGRAENPENTIKAFSHALNAGTEAVESDAWLTREGEVALIHDPWFWVKGANGNFTKTWVENSTVKELAHYKIPTLREFYSKYSNLNKFQLSLDCKDSVVGEEALKLAKAYNRQSELWLCSDSLLTLRSLRKLSAQVNLVHSQWSFNLEFLLPVHCALLKKMNINAINFQLGEWTEDLIKTVHASGLYAFAWDVHEDRDLEAMAAINIDAIYCDRVESIMRLRERLSTY